MMNAILLAAMFAEGQVWVVTEKHRSPVWAITEKKTDPLPHKSWPYTLRVPEGLKVFSPMQVSQRIAVTNGRPSHRWQALNKDDVFSNAPALINPNRKFPWRVSGGMEGLAGWESVKLSNVDPKTVQKWEEAIPIANAGRRLPGLRWAYPEGATFTDLLVNDKGQAFEVRTRKKVAGKWVAHVEFENAAAAPKGYTGAGRCASCHDHAGSSRQYGIMVRGDDTVFSFNPF